MRRATLAVGTCVCMLAIGAVAVAQERGISSSSASERREISENGTIITRGAVQSGGRLQLGGGTAQMGQSLMMGAQMGPMGVPDESQVAEEKIKGLIKQWKAAKSDADRNKIQEQLREVLKGQFQVHLGAHDKEIKKLEAKIKKLSEQLELRRSKQDEIVDFRMQQLLREAQGLGWGSEPATQPARTMQWEWAPRTPSTSLLPPGIPAASPPPPQTVVPSRSTR